MARVDRLPTAAASATSAAVPAPPPLLPWPPPLADAYVRPGHPGIVVGARFADQRRAAIAGERHETKPSLLPGRVRGGHLRPLLGPRWPVRVNAQTAPASLESPGPPISAVLPSADNATLAPNRTPECELSKSEGLSLPPCSAQVEPRRMNTHADPDECPSRFPTPGRRSERCSRPPIAPRSIRRGQTRSRTT